MFANTLGRGARRRGIVLVLILGMLGLLALIGVTFATFAGQSLINARNFSQSEARTGAEQYFDFALGQLINDTNNPLSALRGHSLLRDMYGNDSVFRGTVAAERQGFLDHVVLNDGTRQNLFFGDSQAYSNSSNLLTPALANRPQNYIQIQTNIPTASNSYRYHGMNFTRWIVKLANTYFTNKNGGNQLGTLSQTYEVVEDDDTGTDPFSNGNHLLTLAPVEGGTNLYNNPILPNYPLEANDPSLDKFKVGLTPPANGTNFVLDGRYMRAFNGPGLSRPLIPTVDNSQTPAFPPLVPFNAAAYGNFRANGNLVNPSYDPTTLASFPAGLNGVRFGDPDVIGMDEDYDACDLENWFLAIQSADGQVVIPSFHRPSILTPEDWSSRLVGGTAQEQMNAVAGIAKILRPRRVDNSPQFPTDPSSPDPSTGKITYDVDNDGDGVSDSVWLDLGYPVQRDSGGKLFKPLFAFMIIGQNGRMPLNTVGNLQARDPQYSDTYPSQAAATTLGVSRQLAFAATYYDAPTWDHASHLGASVNEINPKYALQNAPANVYSPNVTVAGFAPTLSDNYNGTSYWSQIDNAGIDVALTQLRALLAGTIPQDNPTNPTNTVTEQNWVAMNGNRYFMPNMVIDQFDNGYNADPTQAFVNKFGVTPVAGRWGEPEGIPQFLSIQQSIFSSIGFTPFVYTNPVRAGRSFYNAATPNISNSFQPTGDSLDDDFDSFGPGFGAAIAEYASYYDSAGQVAVASQRARRFLTPSDPSGNGRVMEWMNRPNDLYDQFGMANDAYGRVSYFRYFRPPGMPHDVGYPLAASMAADSTYRIDAYRMAVLGNPTMPNRTNNPFHSYESFRAPAPDSNPTTYNVAELAKIGVMGAMPFDLTQATQTGGVYPLWPNSAPTMSPSVNSASGPWLLGRPGPNNLTTENGPFLDNANNAGVALVANGYPLGSLNKDEADEMNLYTPNRHDQPFGPSDLEWLYRKQDVDGSTLNSRLSQLAPISFTNPIDGQMRRRLFGLESWEPNSFVWSNDNPIFFNAANYSTGTAPFTQPQYPYNSRFASFGNASIAGLNQVPNTTPVSHFANVNTVEGVPNPTLDAPIVATTPPAPLSPIATDPYLNPNPSVTSNNYAYPDPSNSNNVLTQTLPLLVSQGGFLNAVVNTNSPHYPNTNNGYNASGNVVPPPANTPALAHRDRRINLNMPLPIASDPAEPVRQKWCREAYQLLKATLPPQAVDTPQELAALSQFVVNILDFRDPDATMTRFVNTDLMIVPATPTAPSSVKFAEVGVPQISVYPAWDPANGTTPTNQHRFFPFDPMIALEQTNPSAGWVAAMTDNSSGTPRARSLYLVQYGMEYSPIAINEVLAYQFNSSPTPTMATTTNTITPRFYVELVNTLADDTSHNPVGSAAGAQPGSGDLNLAGWDFIVTPDTDAQGRPDPVTGNIPALAGLVASTAYRNTTNANVTAGQIDTNPLPQGTESTVPPTAISAWGSVAPPNSAKLPTPSFGWSLSIATGLYNVGDTAIKYIPALRNGGPTISGGTSGGRPAGSGIDAGKNAAGVNQRIGDSFFVLGSPLPTNASDPVPAIIGPPDVTLPDTFFPVPNSPTTAPEDQYYWIHLRRPANPFNPGTEMVVVDSMRFPYRAYTATSGQTVMVNGNLTDQLKTGTAPGSAFQFFSVQRLQPYRGGHNVPLRAPVRSAGTPVTQEAPMPPTAWGYSEQTAPAANNLNNSFAYYGANNGGGKGVIVGGEVFGTIGAINDPADPAWDYFPFHDRDFSSVAELLLVPGCPPGLFTKQFAEKAFDFATQIRDPSNTSSPLTTIPAKKSDYQGGAKFVAATPHAFPYLSDKFYYTAASVNPSTDTADGASAGPYPAQLGGWTGTGWYRMFDFFEVPNSANGAIGTTDAGENFDWYRADRRPGLMNLNLIVDEEVFFGLIDDPRLNIALAQYGYYINNLNLANSGLNPVAILPQIISQVDYYGNVISNYPISDPNNATHTAYVPGGVQSDLVLQVSNGITFNPTPNFVGRGFTYPDPAYSYAGFNQNTITGMKAAFADFIKLRDGGTNFLYGHQAPFTAPGTMAQVLLGGNQNQVWADKPYRSLTYPDINYTIMRPATPMPAASALTFPPPYYYQQDPAVTGGNSPIQSSISLTTGNPFPVPAVPVANPGYVGDPGVRFPWLDLVFPNMKHYNPGYTVGMKTGGNVIPPVPPIPPRRLFQPPDQFATSNASTKGDPNLNGAGSLANLFLADPYAELISPSNHPDTSDPWTNFAPQPPNSTAYNPSTIQRGGGPGPVLGGNYRQHDFVLKNNRQHPYYRTELLQKVMNLSTVRTHQFAVWITVGFFEVTKVGTPELGIADQLGGELGLAAGRNVRYRSFFTIDRTRATGFNPYYPGNFRDCVTYRRRIE
ncbi:hypothetical protein P12x_003232 [Tundrisphaera lichenicola]|uniref:hypothetical protein n=1 Tax=Tundrisphaera lichenicola TaxID=2029860 RepID=UPI003EB7FB8B